MCGRFVLVQKIEKLESRYNASLVAGYKYEPSYNISPGKTSLIIAGDSPEMIVPAVFGLSPFWAKKQMYLFNARAEGDRNQENSPDYKGAKDIITKPAFRKPIRSQRCLVPADAFIEGTTAEGLSKPFLVYLKNKQRPFSFAGLYDDWTNPLTNETIRTFSIITTTSNELLQKIPHHRSPVILSQYYEKKWINHDIPLTDITDMLKPLDASLMNAYPISDLVKNPKNDSPDLIERKGDSLVAENDIQVKQSLNRQGFGRNNRSF